MIENTSPFYSFQEFEQNVRNKVLRFISRITSRRKNYREEFHLKNKIKNKA